MKVLSTRTSADGHVVRRRIERADGTRYTTVEMPVSVLKTFSAKAVQDAVARYSRGEANRQRAAGLRAAVAVSTDSATELAARHGCTEARVRQIRQALAADAAKIEPEESTPATFALGDVWR